MLVWKCPRCGTQLSASDADVAREFACPSCGEPSKAPAAPATPAPPPIPPTYSGSQPFMAAAQPGMRPARCSRLVFIILAICLGSFGVHNFVAGYTNRGLTQLLISGCCTVLAFCTLGLSMIVVFGIHIWALVEIVTTTKDADGVPMP